MIPIFPVMNKTDEETQMKIRPEEIETRDEKIPVRGLTFDDHLESVDITAPPPTACVLNEKDHPLNLSPVKDSSEVAETTQEQKKKEEEEGETEKDTKEQLPTETGEQNGRRQSFPLRKKTSFWDFFRPNNLKNEDQQQEDDTKEQKTKELDPFITELEEKLNRATDEEQRQTITKQIDDVKKMRDRTISPEEKKEKNDNKEESEPMKKVEETVIPPKEEMKPILRRQASMMSLAFSIPWTKRTRRLTDSSYYSSSGTTNAAFPSSGIPSRSSTLESRNFHLQDGEVTPSQLCQTDDKNGHQLAEEIVKFAHARHTIKTTNDLDILRNLATELESAFRFQIDKVAVLHTQLENVHWRQHDLQDENKHLRFQMLNLNEQIVQQHAQIEALSQTVKALSSTTMVDGTSNVAIAKEGEEIAEQQEEGSYLDKNNKEEPIVISSKEEQTEKKVHFSCKGKEKAKEDDTQQTIFPTLHHLDNDLDQSDDQAVLFSAGIISANLSSVRS